VKLDEMSKTQSIYRGNNKCKNKKSVGKSKTKRPVFQLASVAYPGLLFREGVNIFS
jgi:hypothetical protein